VAHRHGKPKQGGPEHQPTRRYRRGGVDVEMGVTRGRVELKLDGHPIDVELIEGEFHCQLANQFTAFASIDEIVDTLFANEGRTWTLHGHLCDERCGPGGHHHDHDHGHDHGHEHGHGHGSGR
jgi:FKBP-type peptidyl-prolyl cis-trans isomerase SlyD